MAEGDPNGWGVSQTVPELEREPQRDDAVEQGNDHEDIFRPEFVSHIQGIFHEDVVNKVLNDMVGLLDPWEMEVVGDFNVRGNIKTIIRANHTRK